ncbi:MAG: NUDIX hydrolase [Desulfobacterales bacterium]|jgi:ADP-ribose pyrophosphatase YjhB (NUDIX family)
MNFCMKCGEPVSVLIPDGDDRPRHVCQACGTVHYRNPKMVVGTIPVHDDRILLCRRAIEPRYGRWTLPAGFMENQETVEAGARRETMEEAGAELENLAPFALFSLPFVSQVYLMFRARLLAPVFDPGPESLEVKMVSEDGIPWEEIAFPVIEKTLRLFVADRKTGRYGFHTGTISRRLD